MSESRVYQRVGKYRFTKGYGLRITTIDDTKYLTLIAPLHVDKEIKLPTGYSTEFSNSAMLDHKHTLEMVVECIGWGWFVQHLVPKHFE